MLIKTIHDIIKTTNTSSKELLLMKSTKKKYTKKKEKYYTQSALINDFGLTVTLINKYFPSPSLKPNPYYSNAAPMKIWTEAQVNKALKNPNIKKAVDRHNEKEKEAQRIKAEIIEYLRSFDIENLKEKAKKMDRKFVLHIGPTNSGKTHDAIESLKASKSGLYLGPLRLLALEMFDRLNESNCPCNLVTGEETIETKGAHHTSSTIELCDYSSKYDVVVIDEAQMLTDQFRGDKWVKAIYCVNADKIEICLAPEAEQLVTSIIEGFNADYTIVRHQRLAPLTYKGKFDSIKDAQPGDALIVFSRKAVLAVSAELASLNKQSSVIYGALPPVSRREEVRRFANKETNIVVATDAIGMGISLPIKRIIFCTTSKFDGTATRDITSSEIKQIAGRAGRYGIYDEGEVLSMANEKLIFHSLNTEEKQISELTLPFPEESLYSDYPLDILMEEWDNLPDTQGFTRTDMTVPIQLYYMLKRKKNKIDKALLYRLITCPIDIKNDNSVEYWLMCCNAICEGTKLPEPFANERTLESCENKYKQLDIRHSLLRCIGIEENRMDEKYRLCEKINDFLKNSKEKYLKRCTSCGKPLPSTYRYNICNKCHKEIMEDRYDMYYWQ